MTVDGMSIGHVIVGNAQIESKTDYKNFTVGYLTFCIIFTTICYQGQRKDE